MQEPKYHKLINDSNCESDRVRISGNECYFMGLKDFKGSGEVYNCMFDPDNRVVDTIEANRSVRPYAWIKQHGKGKVFYSMGAHDFETLFSDDCINLILRGVEWCVREAGGLA